MANDLKAGTVEAERALDATAQNADASQRRLDGLLEVAQLARAARQQREREELRATRS